MTTKISLAMKSIAHQLEGSPLKKEFNQIKKQIKQLEQIGNPADFQTAFKEAQSAIEAFTTRCLTEKDAVLPKKLTAQLTEKKTKFIAQQKQLFAREIVGLENRANEELAPLKKQVMLITVMETKAEPEEGDYCPETEEAVSYLIHGSATSILEGLNYDQNAMAASFETLCEFAEENTAENQAVKEQLQAIGESVKKCQELNDSSATTAVRLNQFIETKKGLAALETQHKALQGKLASLQEKNNLVAALELRDAYKKLEIQAEKMLNAIDGLPKHSPVKNEAIALFSDIRIERREVQKLIPAKPKKEEPVQIITVSEQVKSVVEQTLRPEREKAPSIIIQTAPDSPSTPVGSPTISPALRQTPPPYTPTQSPITSSPKELSPPAYSSPSSKEAPVAAKAEDVSPKVEVREIAAVNVAPAMQKQEVQPVAEKPAASKGFGSMLYGAICSIFRAIGNGCSFLANLFKSKPQNMEPAVPESPIR